MANDTANTLEDTLSNFWFQDGSAVYRLGGYAFKLHRSLLDRHSKLLSQVSGNQSLLYGVPVLSIPSELGVGVDDFVVLLEFLYHDIPLDSSSPYVHVASILRISSEQQLQLPSIYARAYQQFIALFPSSPQNLVVPEDPAGALYLAVQHDIRQVSTANLLKRITLEIYFNVATTLHFDSNDAHPSLTPETINRCANLQDSLISHFAPILFTVATGSHMACTDVFAEQWMPLVIGPALASNGVCTPIETLQRIQAVNWGKEGICEECCVEKIKEWDEEIINIWNKVNDWLQL